MNRLDVIYLFLLALVLPCNAQAQSTVQLNLARLCISEAGFQIQHPMSEYTDDCAAIVGVLRNRSHTGKVTNAIMRAYTRRLFHGNTRTVRPWVSFLHLSELRPRHWPHGTSWARHRPRFLEVYMLVGRLLRGEEPTPCSPDHWGAKWRSIQRRARTNGWSLVDCGNTRNDFWRIRRR